MFCSSHFWFLVTFGDKFTKILCILCLNFARQDGQDGKNRKKNHATKVTKRRKYGMNKTFMKVNLLTTLRTTTCKIVSNAKNRAEMKTANSLVSVLCSWNIQIIEETMTHPNGKRILKFSKMWVLTFCGITTRVSI